MLNIENLSIAYTEHLTVTDINMFMNTGEIVGIVGESGSGKSTFLRSLIGLLDRGGKVLEGSVFFNEKNLLNASNDEFRSIRGDDISIIFQHPELMLDPTMTIERLFFETIRVHNPHITKKEAINKASEILKELNFEDVDRILNSYPFELSGGMCQRVMIGMAMVNNPKILLADEPTSALDVTIQFQVVETLKKMREKYKTSILIVTHNMGVIANMVDKIGVMYGGKIVEWGEREVVLKHPLHPYTKALIKAIPKMDCKIPEGINIKAKEFDLKSNKCGFKSICTRYTNECENLGTKKCEVKDNHWILCCKEDVNDFRG